MNMNQKGFASIVLVVIIFVLVGVVGYFAFVKKSKPTTQRLPSPTINLPPTRANSLIPAPTSATAVKDETMSWNLYTYPSTESVILPNIAFKYPSLFGNNPTRISSRSTNRPGNISEDWGGLLEFNPTGTFGDRGLRIEFFKRASSENSFENYIAKSSVSDNSSPKYFQVGNYKVARIRYSSSSHYDADVGWYFVELPNKNILAISTSGDKKLLYDDDKNGNSTRDRIISTLIIGQ